MLAEWNGKRQAVLGWVAAGIENMNKTLSNNFVMVKDLQVQEKDVDGGEDVKNRLNTDQMKHCQTTSY